MNRVLGSVLVSSLRDGFDPSLIPKIDLDAVVLDAGDDQESTEENQDGDIAPGWAHHSRCWDGSSTTFSQIFVRLTLIIHSPNDYVTIVLFMCSIVWVGRLLGVFYGVKHRGRLVSAAGTHILARTMGVAAVGNVCTYPEHRGQGCATRCTSAVCAELLAMGLDVVLNVAQDNADAIHIYKKLGFRVYCPFVEGVAVRKRGGH